MQAELKRYFIELQAGSVQVPRNREAEQRRAQAADFVAAISDWLKEEELEDKVAGMAITALGQVQITCEADVITQIHAQEEDNIAIIRAAAAYVETMGRWKR